MVMTKKSLGQHWLKDSATLKTIAGYAELTRDDTVVEIGPGLGTLTEVLARQAGRVIAVEFDEELAASLRGVCRSNPSPKHQNHSTSHAVESRDENPLSSTIDSETASPPGLAWASRQVRLGPADVSESIVDSASDSIKIINADFLDFDLSRMPVGYKVVGNIPYYITSKIVKKLLTAENKPSLIVLLVQKEVAQRLAAKPGEMSLLSVSAQLYADVGLGPIVKSQLFTPPPKVDSQVVILKVCEKSIFHDLNEKQFFRIVKAGFSARRKKLHTALAGGLNISVDEAKKLLHTANIDSNQRAQNLSIDDWIRLSGNR
jgi:16S rRNA (adenine1518-N6/adenine1519-N6)-dimethyltransferase